MGRKIVIPPTPEEKAIKEIRRKRLKIKKLREEYLIRLARVDNNRFNEYVLLDENGEHIKQWVGHIRWQNFIRMCWRNNYHPAIFSMWGHGKSSQIAIGTVLFELGRNPSLRVKIVCNSDGQAKKRVTTLKNYIAGSRRLRKVFPNLRPSSRHWTTHSFDVVGKSYSEIDHSVEAYGITSKVVGGRADLIIFDDVVDNESEQSKSYRETVKENFDSGFMSRLEPNGRVVMIGTFWHVEDLYQDILRRPGWRCLIQGVSEDFKYIEEIDLGENLDTGYDYAA